MSHIAKIDLEITDLAALRVAGESLGLQFCENQRSFRWYAGRTNACAHAFKAPNTNYEIGVIENNGKYRLELDYYGGLSKAVGDNGNKLKQAYAVETALRAARRQGYRMSKTVKEDGTVVLRGRV